MTTAYSARERAYQALRARILNLELEPNECLNDKELAQQLGMSRTPVHEAVITLALAKLVVVRPQSGTFVAPIDTGIVDMEQFSRMVLEKEMVLRAIPRMTGEAVRRYRENLQIYGFYLGSHGPDRKARLFELDNAFHRIAFELNGMEAHFTWMEGLRHHIERVRVLSFIMDLDNDILEEHRALVDALEAQDPDTAVRVLESHLSLYQRHLEKMRAVYPHYFFCEP